MWEVKTSSGLRSSTHQYTWYSSDAASNGGNVGALGTNTCGGSLAAAPFNNECNTQNFVAAVNAVGLCGASDWRLPSQRELLSIVHGGNTNPSIDGAYFPNTFSFCYGTKTTFAADSAVAWFVYFSHGYPYSNVKTSGYVVRLVRGGQSFDALPPALPILNIDGSDAATRYGPATDGVLLLRFLFGLRGTALTAGALGVNPQRSSA